MSCARSAVTLRVYHRLWLAECERTGRLLVQFHGPKVIGYYHEEAEDCDDHEHCIWDVDKIANFAREKVKIHELDEL